MQITLNVEGSQLDGEVKALLESLTDEQKKEMALNLLSKSLDQSGSELMLSTARSRVAEDYNKTISHKTDQVICRNGKWYSAGYDGTFSRELDWSTREKLDKLVDERSQVHSFFKQEVLKQMVKTAEDEVHALIKTSSKINEAIENATKTIEENLPKMVHDAMLMYFCTQMETMSRSIAGAMFQSGSQQKILQEIQQRLS